MLVSYAFLKDWSEEEIGAYFANSEHCDFLLDSGAFTAKNAGYVIELDEYCAFLDRWGDSIFRYLALDVVGDSPATEANLRIMLDRGYKPVPVHVLDDDEERMDELFTYSDYVALAGLRRPHRGAAPKSYVKMKMEWAKGRRVHWLGYTAGAMLRAFRPYSADSSSFASGSRYGQVSVYLGHGRWEKWYRQLKPGMKPGGSAKFKAIDEVSDEVIAIIKEHGFSVADWRSDEQWFVRKAEGRPYTEHIPSVITQDSYVRYSLELWRDYGVRFFLADFPTIADLSKLLLQLVVRRTKEYNDGIA